MFNWDKQQVKKNYNKHSKHSKCKKRDEKENQFEVARKIEFQSIEIDS
jgi:hypothetical protein